MPKVTGQLADIINRRIYHAELAFENGKITGIAPVIPKTGITYPFLLPGFTDAHVHIESSMLIPAEFARLAVVHGTVSTISDPHEIANVCGLAGIEFMIENGRTVPFKFNFGAPSCVPATVFETAGAIIDATATAKLLQRTEIRYLSEMMNFPGVLQGDAEVMAKIAAAKAMDKPVDGHAPGLRGQEAGQYIAAGISTDHECFTTEEALDKLQRGMKILIREGSAARNFDALIDLLHDYPEHMMFCSDDKHPDSLVAGHINQLCARAVARGINLFHVLQAACINPVLHYRTDTGLLRPGDAADFILVKDLEKFEVLQTYIDGQLVADKGRTLIQPHTMQKAAINHFLCTAKTTADLALPWKNEKTIQVMEALDGQLITGKLNAPPKVADGSIVSDPANDVLKIVVVNRYAPTPVAKAFIKNVGLKTGAIASSVAHDSHNIVAVGADDESLCRAINLVIEQQGGVSCAGNGMEMILALPVAGLMSAEDGYQVAESYTAIDQMAKSLGSGLSAPFMTLSFMALLVIPHLKLSDKGLFDGDAFALLSSAATAIGGNHQ